MRSDRRPDRVQRHCSVVVLLARLILGAGIGVVVHAIPIRIADEIAAAALVGEMLPR
jgi:hypothetical protein